jgi:hypothetical protein
MVARACLAISALVLMVLWDQGVKQVSKILFQSDVMDVLLKWADVFKAKWNEPKP